MSLHWVTQASQAVAAPAYAPGLDAAAETSQPVTGADFARPYWPAGAPRGHGFSPTTRDHVPTRRWAGARAAADADSPAAPAHWRVRSGPATPARDNCRD